MCITSKEGHRLRVFANRVLRKISGSKRVEVREEWRRLHNEKLYYLYSSLNIIGVIKSRRMRWGGGVRHAWRRGEVHIEFWWVNLRRRDQFEDTGTDGRIMLNWIFNR
jgi:hypothetical protein